MIAIDTNVLIRIIVRDDDIQAKKAFNLIKKQEQVFVSLLVLQEVVWVLSTVYSIKKEKLIDIIDHILRGDCFFVESTEAVWFALIEYQQSDADFADCLIGTVARSYGYLHVATFDKDASKTQCFELIK